MSQLVQMTKEAGFGIKAMKTWTGRDGVGFECTVTFKGKKAGRYLQEGSGGMGRLYWDVRDGAAEQAFNALLPTLPEVPYGCGMEGSHKPDADHVFAVLGDDLELERRVKRDAKAGRTVIRDANGEVYVYKVAYTPDVAAKLKAKNPGCVILNEVYATA